MYSISIFTYVQYAVSPSGKLVGWCVGLTVSGLHPHFLYLNFNKLSNYYVNNNCFDNISKRLNFNVKKD